MVLDPSAVAIYHHPLFPRGVLFLQWGLSLAASAVFLAGYGQRWFRTPSAMAVVYAAMALVCAIETFIYMQGIARFFAMAAEYVAYVSILFILFRSKHFRAPEAAVMLPSS